MFIKIYEVEKIINQIILFFGKENVKLIFHYGNRKGRDIDIFVILKDDSEYNCLKIMNLDISYVGLSEALVMAKNLDPLLTEPILFGDFLYGEKDELRSSFIRINSSKEIVKYLQDKSNNYLNWAETYFNSCNLSLSCDCIRFSLSFYLFSLYYAKNTKVINFKSILTIYKDYSLLIRKAEILAKNEHIASIELVNELLKENKKILTKIFN